MMISSQRAVFRGVQYVHCVMHKCIMGKVGGKEIQVKFIKKTGKFYEIRWEKFAKVGEKGKFFETGGNALKQKK